MLRIVVLIRLMIRLRAIGLGLLWLVLILFCMCWCLMGLFCRVLNRLIYRYVLVDYALCFGWYCGGAVSVGVVGCCSVDYG